MDKKTRWTVAVLALVLVVHLVKASLSTGSTNEIPSNPTEVYVTSVSITKDSSPSSPESSNNNNNPIDPANDASETTLPGISEPSDSTNFPVSTLHSEVFTSEAIPSEFPTPNSIFTSSVTHEYSVTNETTTENVSISDVQLQENSTVSSAEIKTDNTSTTTVVSDPTDFSVNTSASSADLEAPPVTGVDSNATTETVNLTTSSDVSLHPMELETTVLSSLTTDSQDQESTTQSSLSMATSSVPLHDPENVTAITNVTVTPQDLHTPNATAAAAASDLNGTDIAGGNFSSTLLDAANSSMGDGENGDDTNGTSWNDSPVVLEPTTQFSVDDGTVANASDTEPFNETATTAAPPLWFLLQLSGNCTLASEEFDDFEQNLRDQVLSQAGVPAQNVTVNMNNCSKNFLLNVSVSPEFAKPMSQFFKRLDATNHSRTIEVNHETYLLNVVEPAGNNAYRQPPDVVLSSRHTDIEFVIYVALGSACAFLLVLAVLLVTCKYCRSKPYKGFDVSDGSHLNLRLEDYTLTRIPRPKSIYTEYCRGANRDTERYCPLDEQSLQANGGMVHPFDTSIVPLEDAPEHKVEAPKTKPPSAPEDAASPNPTAAHHEYEEIDVNSVNSTENLHRQKVAVPQATPWGVDNVSFAT